jgi:hypothetical protein
MLMKPCLIELSLSAAQRDGEKRTKLDKGSIKEKLERKKNKKPEESDHLALRILFFPKREDYWDGQKRKKTSWPLPAEYQQRVEIPKLGSPFHLDKYTYTNRRPGFLRTLRLGSMHAADYLRKQQMEIGFPSIFDVDIYEWKKVNWPEFAAQDRAEKEHTQSKSVVSYSTGGS